MLQTAPKKPLGRMRFLLVLACLAVIVWQAVEVVRILQSADLHEQIGFNLWRESGAVPEGTAEITEAQLASLSYEFPRVFAQALAAGEGGAWISEPDVEKFLETIRAKEQSLDGLARGPAGYVQSNGTLYFYTFTLTGQNS